MTTEYLAPSTEQEWLSWRARDVTSTESAALFGMSPYMTAYELYHVKRGELENVFDDNERIQAGRHLEPAIASLVAERYGVIVEPFKQYATDRADRIGGSFDYLIVGVQRDTAEDDRLQQMFHAHGPGILEIKNVDSLAFKRRWQEDETPAHIEIQLQHQLELTRHPWGCIVPFVGGHTTELYIRERRPDVGQAIREAVREFWRSVEAGTPPPVVYPDDAEVVIALHQYSDGSVVEATAEQEALIAEYLECSAAESAAGERKKIIKAELLQQVGDAGKLLFDGGSVSLTQTKDSEGKLVTPEMVGTYVGARQGYRNFRVYTKKEQTK